MRRYFMVAVAVVACVGFTSSVDAQSAKPKRFKNEALKKGVLTIEPEAGYVLVRVLDKSPAVGVWRQPPGGGDRYPPEVQKNKELRDTFGALTNPGRSWEDGDGLGTFVLKLYPGRYLISGVGGTCMSMGTYSFDVPAGQVVDIGTVLTAREDGRSSIPELKNVSLSDDLVRFGTMTNIVMSNAMFVKPPTSGTPVPAGMGNANVKPAVLTPDVRIDNICEGLTNRASNLPPMGHQKPMTASEAAAHFAERKAREEEDKRLSK